jgi:FKBP-type peptidyl-prolyl cis-trans isomerase FklB
MSTITENKGITGGQQHSLQPMSRRCGMGVALRAGVALLGMCLGAGVQGGDTSAEMNGGPARAGYSAGYAFGGQLARLQGQKPGVELEAVFRGILDALSGAKPHLSTVEMRAALNELEQGGPAGIPARGKAPQMQTNARRGRGGYNDDFAALNARREGVVTLPSGVQYEVLKASSGRQPSAGGAVLVSYQGSLTNGAVFDSTYEDGNPVRLQLEEIVVPGLKEALLLMNQGAKWRVVIPPSMGFKRSGNNQLRRRDLIYEIELVAVEAPPATTSTPAAAQP